MKKVTISINGAYNNESLAKVSRALNDLSGVVAADVSSAENLAFAYAGDKLSKTAIIGAVNKEGVSASVVNETYLSGVEDLK